MDEPGGSAGTAFEPLEQFMDLGIDAAIAFVVEPEHRVVRRFGDIGLEDEPCWSVDQAPGVDAAELSEHRPRVGLQSSDRLGLREHPDS